VTYSEVYNALRTQGAKTIPFQTRGGRFVDVWASELTSGPRKGQKVIRVNWVNSSSTLDKYEWDEPKTSLIRHLRMAVESTLV